MQLEVVVKPNCPSCDEARRIAREVAARFPGLSRPGDRAGQRRRGAGGGRRHADVPPGRPGRRAGEPGRGAARTGDPGATMRRRLFLALTMTACAPPARLPAAPTAAPPPAAASAPAVTVVALDAGEEPRPAGFTRAGWKTDFSRRTIDLAEITSGGPPRDGIPPLDKPIFETVQQAGGW